MSEELLNENFNEITNKQQLIQILQKEDEHYLKNFLEQQQQTIRNDPESFFIATKNDNSPVETALDKPAKAVLLLETISTLPDKKQQAIFKQAYQNNYLDQLAYHAATHRIPVMKNLLKATEADRPYSFFQTSPKKDKEANWYIQEGAVLRNIKASFNTIYLEKLELALSDHQNDCVDANPDLNGLGKSLDQYFKEHPHKQTAKPEDNSSYNPRVSSTSDPSSLAETVSPSSPPNNNRSTTMNLIDIIESNSENRIPRLQDKLSELSKAKNKASNPLKDAFVNERNKHGLDPLTLAAQQDDDTEAMTIMLSTVNSNLKDKEKKELFSNILDLNIRKNDNQSYAKLAQCAVKNQLRIIKSILDNETINDYARMTHQATPNIKNKNTNYYQAIQSLLRSLAESAPSNDIRQNIVDEATKHQNEQIKPENSGWFSTRNLADLKGIASTIVKNIQNPRKIQSSKDPQNLSIGADTELNMQLNEQPSNEQHNHAAPERYSTLIKRNPVFDNYTQPLLAKEDSSEQYDNQQGQGFSWSP